MGNRLFKEVTALTKLPKNLISEELVTILKNVGTSPQSMTLEDLRKAMAAYLTDVMGQKKKKSLKDLSPEFVSKIVK